MESVGKFNHEVSIVGYWIFDFKYKNSFLLTLYSLSLIFPPSVGEVILDLFESVFHAVRYINNIWKLNISD